MKKIFVALCLAFIAVLGATVFPIPFQEKTYAEEAGSDDNVSEPVPLTFETSRFSEPGKGYLIAGLAGGCVAVISVGIVVGVLFRRRRQ